METFKNTLMRRMLAVGAGVALAVGLAVAPAHAASAYQPCPVAAACLWNDNYRGGAVAFYRLSNAGDGNPVLRPGTASSLWNRSPYTFRVYVTRDCTGSSLAYEDFGPGAYGATLGSYGLNNNIRSVRLLHPGGYTGPC